MEYEELIQLHQEGKISNLELVEQQEDLKEIWEDWLKDNNREKNNISAWDFLLYMDEYVMSHQEAAGYFSESI